MSLSESFKVLLVSLFFFGCQTQNRYEFSFEDDDPRGGFRIEDEFLTYALDFEALSNKPVTTPIYFADGMNPLVFALCISWRKENNEIVKEIKVNRQLWFEHDAIEREMIIFHELGHCELNRKHTVAELETEDFRQIPSSLMYPTLFSKKDYAKFHEHFTHELFGRDTPLVSGRINDSLQTLTQNIGK